MTESTLSVAQALPTSPPIPSTDGPVPSSGGGIYGLLSKVTVRTRLLALAGTLGVLWALVVIFSLTGISSTKSHYTKASNGVTQLQAFHSSYEAWFEGDDVADLAGQLEELNVPTSNPLLKQVLPLIPPELNAASAALTKVLAYPSSPAMVAKVHQLQNLL